VFLKTNGFQTTVQKTRGLLVTSNGEMTSVAQDANDLFTFKLFPLFDFFDCFAPHGRIHAAARDLSRFHPVS
jgi:hypothetical protein